MSGFSFKEGGVHSPWLAPDRVFTTDALQKRYSTVEMSLLTPKCTLVPVNFYDPVHEREALADMVSLEPEDVVSSIPVEDFGAVLVYSNSIGESLSRVLSKMVLDPDGNSSRVLPEMYYILRDLSSCKLYNKILCSWYDSYLYLAVAQGRTLMFCNVFRADEFTTAEYFLFLVMKKLQMNPEVSCVTFRTPLDEEQEASLYRYFKSVEFI